MTSASTASAEPLLSAVEARIIGCLMEKQRTTPEQYPLTLNGLVSACNQKSARQPVMNLEPGAIAHTLGVLRDRGLVHVSFTGRSERYDHKMVGTFFLSREEQAVLAVLMLRGPQTLGELRTNCTRMAEFASLDAVAATLRGLAERDQALVIELPRLPGRREERYAHLLCGRPAAEALAESLAESLAATAAATLAASDGEPARTTGRSALEARVAALEDEVTALRHQLERLLQAVGLPPDDQRDTD